MKAAVDRAGHGVLAVIALVFMMLAGAVGGQEVGGETAAPSREAGGLVLILEVDGPIGPATADYVERGLERARERGASLAVIRMDTPGGLADSMRAIIRAILASPVPVASLVAPAGAHAASAGTYILYASHIAAMAPGTNLGAATPVQIGGGGLPGQPERAPEPDPARGTEGSEGGEGETGAEPAASEADASGEDARDERGRDPEGTGSTSAGMQEKAVNDSAAYIRSLAQLRGRNADWAERAVREAASLSAAEALELDVIDLIARDIDALLAAVEGQTIDVDGEEIALAVADAPRETYAPDWRVELLSILTNPNVAYILMLVGIYGIIFEFYSPGLVFPGVVGAISLLLALYAFQVLPVNTAGIALIGLGLALMIGEMLVPSFGALGLGGIVAFVVGSIMLMDTDVAGFGISWQVIGGVALGAASLLLVVMSMLARSWRTPVVSGQEWMIGHLGRVLEWDGDAGRIHVDGETWRAQGPQALARGQSVRIEGVDGLTLTIRPEGPDNRPRET